MEALTVIVGILSILTTVLIGWQIYNVITLERRVDRKVKARIDKVTEKYMETQKIQDQCNYLSHRITLVKLLGIIELLARESGNSIIMSRCILLNIEDIVKSKDKEFAPEVLEQLQYMIEHQYQFQPFLKDTWDKIERSLKELCKVDDVGFECLKLLEQLRPENQPVK